MWKVSILAVVFGAVILVGAIGTMYQIYRMTEADAKARGLKHPRFWGLFAMNGNNSGGLLLYLLGRRKFPVIDQNETVCGEIEARKKKAGIGLLFLVIGGIGMIASLFLG